MNASGHDTIALIHLKKNNRLLDMPTEKEPIECEDFWHSKSHSSSE